MALVNCSVLCKTNNKLLLPWDILSIGTESGITIEQFYQKSIVPELEKCHDVSSFEMKDAFLGRSKDSLDGVSLSVPLDSAIQTFGPYLRYHTEAKEAVCPPRVDAFALMMCSQRQIDQRKLPSKLVVRTKKDQLFNDVVDMLKPRGLLFSSNEVASSGQNLVKLLTDSLWYIDGHHESMKKQSCPIPEAFRGLFGKVKGFP